MKPRTIAAVAAVPVVLAAAPTAHAAPPPGAISSTTYAATREVPCDGVIYPVLTSTRAYTSPAGTKITLIEGASQKLSVADATATTDSVTSTWTVGGEINLSWTPKWGTVASGSGGGKVSGSYSRSHVQGTTITFTQTTDITLTPKVANLAVTPVYYKIQGWGDYYRCDVGATEPVRLSNNEIYVDVTDAAGWLLDCNGRPCEPGKDYA